MATGSFAGDVEFTGNAGLPGGTWEVALFHYAIEGFVFDQLTGPLLPDVSPDEVVDHLVTRLIP